MISHADASMAWQFSWADCEHRQGITFLIIAV